MKPLTNRQFRELVRSIEANSHDEQYCASILEQLVKGKNCIEKFINLLQLRIVTFGDNAKFKVGDITLSVYLSDVINKIKKLHIEPLEITNQQITYTFNVPRHLYTQFFDNQDITYLFSELLSSVIIGDDIYEDLDLHTLEDHKVFDQLINYLPANITSKVHDYILDINDKLQEVIFLSAISADQDEMRLDLFNNSLFFIVKSLFQTTMRDFAEQDYICLSKMGISGYFYLNVTPKEIYPLIELYKKDQEEQEKQMKKEAAKIKRAK